MSWSSPVRTWVAGLTQEKQSVRSWKFLVPAGFRIVMQRISCLCNPWCQQPQFSEFTSRPQLVNKKRKKSQKLFCGLAFKSKSNLGLVHFWIRIWWLSDDQLVFTSYQDSVDLFFFPFHVRMPGRDFVLEKTKGRKRLEKHLGFWMVLSVQAGVGQELSGVK